MTGPAHVFRIARIARLREVLQGSIFGIPSDPNTSQNPTWVEAIDVDVLGQVPSVEKARTQNAG
ncbi:hypothetical protein ACVWYH_006222 [Bradyrhizobium sp. GM24.11]